MIETSAPELVRNAPETSHASVAPSAQPCEECVGGGGWFRYEPALEPAPGLLYLSCLRCRGTGRSAQSLD